MSRASQRKDKEAGTATATFRIFQRRASALPLLRNSFCKSLVMKDRLKSGISRVDDAKASSSFVEQPASAAGGVLLGERDRVRGEGELTCIVTAMWSGS